MRLRVMPLWTMGTRQVTLYLISDGGWYALPCGVAASWAAC